MKLFPLKLASLIALSFTSTIVVADNSYQHDASLSFGDHSENDGNGTLSFNYQYFTSKVSQQSNPYILSGYLAQTSNVQLGYSQFDSDNNAALINGRYVFNNDWFIEAAYNRTSFNDGDQTGNSVSFGGGYYLNKSSSVFMSYSKGSSESEFGFLDYTFKSESDSDSLTIGADSYISFDTTEGLLLSGSYSYTSNDYNNSEGDSETTTDSSINIATDWFVTRSWFVGASYSKFFGDFDFDFKSINTGYYLPLGDNFALEANLSKSLDSEADGFGYGVSVRGRF